MRTSEKYLLVAHSTMAWKIPVGALVWLKLAIADPFDGHGDHHTTKPYLRKEFPSIWNAAFLPTALPVPTAVTAGKTISWHRGTLLKSVNSSRLACKFLKMARTEAVIGGGQLPLRLEYFSILVRWMSF